jgi:hypothetical protein
MHCKITVNTFVTRNQFVRKVNPGIKPRFFNQYRTKCSEKKIPSTAAKAIKRSANESDSIHFKAQSAFFLIAGKTSTH